MEEWILSTGSEVAGAIPAEVPAFVQVQYLYSSRYSSGAPLPFLF